MHMSAYFNLNRNSALSPGCVSVQVLLPFWGTSNSQAQLTSNDCASRVSSSLLHIYKLDKLCNVNTACDSMCISEYSVNTLVKGQWHPLIYFSAQVCTGLCHATVNMLTTFSKVKYALMLNRTADCCVQKLLKVGQRQR
jgi:hypothetical protein